MTFCGINTDASLTLVRTLPGFLWDVYSLPNFPSQTKQKPALYSPRRRHSFIYIRNSRCYVATCSRSRRLYLVQRFRGCSWGILEYFLLGQCNEIRNICGTSYNCRCNTGMISFYVLEKAFNITPDIQMLCRIQQKLGACRRARPFVDWGERFVSSLPPPAHACLTLDMLGYSGRRDFMLY